MVDDDAVDRMMAGRCPQSGALLLRPDWSAVRATDWCGARCERTRRNAIAKDALRALIRPTHMEHVVRTHRQGFR